MSGYTLDSKRPVEILEASKNIIILRINGTPIPWTAPRVGKNGTYAPHGEMKKYLKRRIGLLYNGPLITKPVTCDLNFYMPVTKSEEKKFKAMREKGERIFHKKKPDRINLAKFAEDLLEGSILKNDSQIIGGNIQKEYTPTFACTLISIFIHD